MTRARGRARAGRTMPEFRMNSARALRAGTASGGGRSPGGEVARDAAGARCELGTRGVACERHGRARRGGGAARDRGSVRGGADRARVAAVERVVMMRAAEHDHAEEQQRECRGEPAGGASEGAEWKFHGLPGSNSGGRGEPGDKNEHAPACRQAIPFAARRALDRGRRTRHHMPRVTIGSEIASRLRQYIQSCQPQYSR